MDKKLKLYTKNEDYTLYEGNMLDMLEVIEPNSIDSIVTDPPYGLTSICNRFGKENSAPAQYGKDGAFSRLSKGFMGKEWDGSGIEYNVETWKKCFEVLKPGGYLLAFGGTRTYHRIAYAIENAGFEIRDCIMWLYGSGFPKNMNIEKAINKREGVLFSSKPASGVGFMNSNNDGWHNTYNQLVQVGMSTDLAKKWQGWGTCLKPAYEPIIVARKPFVGSLVDNIIKNKVGGINIGECRIGNEYIKGGTMPDLKDVGKKSKETIGINKLSFGQQLENIKRLEYEGHSGRFPTNVIHDGLQEKWARYFYCAKTSKKDRDEGLDNFETKTTGELQGGRKEGSAGSIMINEDGSKKVNPYAGIGTPKKNTHPTVKPTSLMQYLVRLVTPKDGVVLDPFMGSGSTGKAVMYENKERQANYKFIGIELTKEYLPIAEARINYVLLNRLERVC